MRLYIKGNYDKKIDSDYRELAGKMWFEEKEGKPVELSYAISSVEDISGIPLDEEASLELSLVKTLHDSRWNSKNRNWDDEKHPQSEDCITMDFEDSVTSGYHSKREMLRITTSYIEALTVDKRAMYIMAVEIATAIDGQISEDDKQSWLSPENFKKKHQDIFNLTYDEANEISLEEIKTLSAEHEPSWFEEIPGVDEDYIPKEILEHPFRFRAYLYELMVKYFNHKIDFYDFSWDFGLAMKDEDTCFGGFTAEEYIIISTMQATISRANIWGEDLENPEMAKEYLAIEDVEKRLASLYQELKALNDAPKAQEEQPKKVELKTLLKTFRKSFEGILGKFPQGTKAHQDEAGEVAFSLIIYNTRVTFKIDSQNMLDILVDEHGNARSLWYFMRSGDAKKTGYTQDKGIYLGDEEAVKQSLEILKKHLYDTISFGF